MHIPESYWSSGKSDQSYVLCYVFLYRALRDMLDSEPSDLLLVVLENSRKN